MAGATEETARVVPFVPRARTGLERKVEAGGVVAMPSRQPDAPGLVEYGSGWYHAAAIEEERGDRGADGGPVRP